MTKCANSLCNREIEDWASGNKDEEGFEYCMACVANFEHFAEMEDLEE